MGGWDSSVQPRNRPFHGCGAFPDALPAGASRREDGMIARTALDLPAVSSSIIGRPAAGVMPPDDLLGLVGVDDPLHAPSLPKTSRQLPACEL